MSDQIDVPYVAGLARLHLRDEEVARFEKQLGQVLAYVEQLRAADVSGVSARGAERDNVLREDRERAGFDPAQALANAPRQAGGLFIVPKVVE